MRCVREKLVNSKTISVPINGAVMIEADLVNPDACDLSHFFQLVGSYSECEGFEIPTVMELKEYLEARMKATNELADTDHQVTTLSLVYTESGAGEGHLTVGVTHTDVTRHINPTPSDNPWEDQECQGTVNLTKTTATLVHDIPQPDPTKPIYRTAARMLIESTNTTISMEMMEQLLKLG